MSAREYLMPPKRQLKAVSMKPGQKMSGTSVRYSRRRQSSSWPHRKKGHGQKLGTCSLGVEVANTICHEKCTWTTTRQVHCSRCNPAGSMLRSQTHWATCMLLCWWILRCCCSLAFWRFTYPPDIASHSLDVKSKIPWIIIGQIRWSHEFRNSI